jgi:hypothetical protein
MNPRLAVVSKPPAAVVRFPPPLPQTIPKAVDLLAQGKYYDAIIADHRETYFGGKTTMDALMAAIEAVGLDRQNPVAGLVTGVNGSRTINHAKLLPDEQALHALATFGDKLAKAGFTEQTCIVLLVTTRMRLSELTNKYDW